MSRRISPGWGYLRQRGGCHDRRQENYGKQLARLHPGDSGLFYCLGRRAMSIREKIRAEVRGKIVIISISAEDETELKMLNVFVDDKLQLLQDAEMVKYFKNRIDYFSVMPQTDVQPVELM